MAAISKDHFFAHGMLLFTRQVRPWALSDNNNKDITWHEALHSKNNFFSLPLLWEHVTAARPHNGQLVIVFKFIFLAFYGHECAFLLMDIIIY